MGKNKQRAHSIDLLFILSLFCVFAASAVLVITFGANVYKSIVTQMEDNYGARVSLSYIANQVRQHDRENMIRVTTLGEETALMLGDGAESDYATFIYHHDGALRELYCDKNEPLSVEDGLPVIKLAQCQMTLQDNRLWIQVTDENGKSNNMVLMIHTLAKVTGGVDNEGR